MYTVIIGCGRLGSKIANYLSEKGNVVTMIDPNKDSFKRLNKNENINMMVGTGIDIDTLEKAKATEADLFIAVTNGDNTNLLTSQIAKKKFNVPKIITRIYDPERASAYKNYGFSILCPTTVGFDLILKELSLK